MRNANATGASAEVAIAGGMPDWYAVIHPGLEPALERELTQLGLQPVLHPGGARVRAALKDGALLSARLRTPSRLLLELGGGQVLTLDALAALTRSIDWRPYLQPWSPVEVVASTQRSRLRFRDVAAAKVEHAIKDALRGPRLPGLRRDPIPQRVHLRIEDDRATLSIDAGGELLHLRGWRQDAGKAPLRENLAAALLMLADWRPDEALVDPFCGSGTLPIEAALMASGRPPWVGRSFAWQGWPAMEGTRLPDPRKGGPAPRVPIVGADRERQALGGAFENARRAGVNVQWVERDVAELDAPAASGLVIANPPYGHRLGQRVDGVYVAFGRTLRARFAGWRAMWLCPDPAQARLVDRNARRIAGFSNGGLDVGVWVSGP